MDYNLFDEIKKLPEYDEDLFLSESIFCLVRVARGVIISASSLDTYAFTCSTDLPFDMSIILLNDGIICGKGGTGGDGLSPDFKDLDGNAVPSGIPSYTHGMNGRTDFSDSDKDAIRQSTRGGDAGNAIYADFDLIIVNHGVIGGGGGGGSGQRAFVPRGYGAPISLAGVEPDYGSDFDAFEDNPDNETQCADFYENPSYTVDLPLESNPELFYPQSESIVLPEYISGMDSPKTPDGVPGVTYYTHINVDSESTRDEWYEFSEKGVFTYPYFNKKPTDFEFKHKINPGVLDVASYAQPNDYIREILGDSYLYGYGGGAGAGYGSDGTDNKSYGINSSNIFDGIPSESHATLPNRGVTFRRGDGLLSLFTYNLFTCYNYYYTFYSTLYEGNTVCAGVIFSGIYDNYAYDKLGYVLNIGYYDGFDINGDGELIDVTKPGPGGQLGESGSASRIPFNNDDGNGGSDRIGYVTCPGGKPGKALVYKKGISVSVVGDVFKGNPADNTEEIE